MVVKILELKRSNLTTTQQKELFMNESLQLAKLFKISCSNINYSVFGIFPQDQDDQTILDFMSQNDEKIRAILSSQEIDVKIESENVWASMYCLAMPEEIFNERVVH